MEEVLNHIQTILAAIEGIFLVGGTITGTVFSCSKKARKWLNDKISNTEVVKSIKKSSADLSEKVDDIGINQKKLEKELKNLKIVLEQDKATTLLTTKYEILDICNRAARYNGIISTDKELLCELYHQYVDVWKENHYVKSTADYVINNLPVVDKYIRN